MVIRNASLFFLEASVKNSLSVVVTYIFHPNIEYSNVNTNKQNLMTQSDNQTIQGK